MKFKLGDKVRVVRNDDSNGGHIGKEAIIWAVNSQNSEYFYQLRGDNGEELQTPEQHWADHELELIESEGGVVSKIVDKLRELKLSKQDRILYKHGLIHETGQLTSDGKDAVLQASFDTVKDDLVADLKKIDAEEKK